MADERFFAWVGSEEGSPHVFATLGDGTVICVERDRGDVLWSSPTAAEWGLGCVAEGKVYVCGSLGSQSRASHSGELFVLDAKTGGILWQSRTGEYTSRGPAAARGLCYTSSGSSLYAFRTAEVTEQSEAARRKLSRLVASAPSPTSTARLRRFVLDKTPADGAAWRHLAERHEKAGEQLEALRAWQKCAELAPVGSLERGEGLRRLDEVCGVRWIFADAMPQAALSDTLVIVAGTRHLHALDRGAGVEQWRQTTGREPSWPCIAGDIVCCGILRKGMAAYRVDDGARRWNIDLGSGRFYLGAEGGRLFAAEFAVGVDRFRCIDLATGHIKWEYVPSLPGCPWVRHRPCVAEGRVFIHTDTAGMYAVDARSGKEIWRRESMGDNWHSYAFLYHDGLLYAGNNVGVAHCVDAHNGKLVWEQTLEELTSPCYVAPGGLAIYSCRHTHSIRAFDAKTGEPKWQREVPGPWTAMGKNGVAYVSSGPGYVYALDEETGEQRWRLNLGASLSLAAIDDTQLYVSRAMCLYALDLKKLDELASQDSYVFDRGTF